MAKKPTSAEAKIDPSAQYTVKLNRSVKIGPTWLRPGSERVRVDGATLEMIRDAVSEYEIVK